MQFKNKNATFDLIKESVLHIFLIGIIFALFFIGITVQTSSYNIKQQVLEKQTALMIDSSFSGNEITIQKKNRNGYISELILEENRVFVFIENKKYSKGYPYFSEYSIEIKEQEDKFIITVK